MCIRTVADAAGLNAALMRATLDRRARSAGTRVSNVGGWQSAPDLFDWSEPSVKRLAAEINLAVRQMWAFPSLMQGQPPSSPCPSYYISGWANVNERGHYNLPHLHLGSDVSIVYYVAAGTPVPDNGINGCLELRDPRPAAAFSRIAGGAQCGPLLIAPEAGMMVAFPAWIEHWVHPYEGEGPRISIAANVTFNVPTN